MNGKQHAVLWLGLLLILVRLGPSGQWSAIWGTISNGSIVNWSGGSGSNPSSGPGGILNTLPNAPGSTGAVRLLPNGIPILNPSLYANALKDIGQGIVHPPGNTKAGSTLIQQSVTP